MLLHQQPVHYVVLLQLLLMLLHLQLDQSEESHQVSVVLHQVLHHQLQVDSIQETNADHKNTKLELNAKLKLNVKLKFNKLKPKPKPNVKLKLRLKPNDKPRSNDKLRLKLKLNVKLKLRLKPNVKPRSNDKLKHKLKPNVKPKPKQRLNVKLKLKLKPNDKLRSNDRLKHKPKPNVKLKLRLKPNDKPRSNDKLRLKLKPNVKPKLRLKLNAKPKSNDKLKPKLKLNAKLKPNVKLKPMLNPNAELKLKLALVNTTQETSVPTKIKVKLHDQLEMVTSIMPQAPEVLITHNQLSMDKQPNNNLSSKLVLVVFQVPNLPIQMSSMVQLQEALAMKTQTLPEVEPHSKLSKVDLPTLASMVLMKTVLQTLLQSPFNTKHFI